MDSIDKKKRYTAPLSPSNDKEMELLLNEFANMGFPDNPEKAFMARGQCHSILKYIRKLEDFLQKRKELEEELVFRYLRDYEIGDIMEIVNSKGATSKKINDNDCRTMAKFIIDLYNKANQ